MSIKAELVKQMNEAAKAQDKIRLGALRNILAQVKNKEIALIKRTEGLSDEEVVSVIKTMVKQSLESIDQFKKGGRQDLVDKETREIQILESFLPKQLSPAEVETLVKRVIGELGAAGPKDMGPVMKLLKDKTAGRVDGRVLSDKVKAKLAVI